MTEAITAAGAMPKFTTVKYTSPSGEEMTATKNNGVVTVVGEKSGTRQMPVEDFIKNELPQIDGKVQLEKVPNSDVVVIKNTEKAQEKAPIAKAENEPVKEAEVKEGKKLDAVA